MMKTTAATLRDNSTGVGELVGHGNGGDGAARRGPEREWVDWEDLILEDTVPLVGFVRMILHSGK